MSELFVVPSYHGVTKISEEDRLIAGWISVEVVDRQGEVIPIEELRKAMVKFMDRGGPLLFGHSNRPIGKILSYEVREHPDTGKPGIYVIAKIFRDYTMDDIVWELIKEGKITGFSVAGRAEAEVVQGDGGTHVSRKNIELLEISLVDRPANPYAIIEEYNVFAKGDERDCESRYMEDERHFKLMTCPGSESGKKWRFCGCVRYMICRGYDSEEAEAICRKIKDRENGGDSNPDAGDVKKEEGVVDADAPGMHNECYGPCKDKKGYVEAEKSDDSMSEKVHEPAPDTQEAAPPEPEERVEHGERVEDGERRELPEPPSNAEENAEVVKEDDGCKKRYLVEERGGGSHFKEMTCPDNPDNSSRFCGCVRYFMTCQGRSLDSAKRICAYIKRMKYGKADAMSMEELEELVKDLITIVIDPVGDEDVKVETESNNKDGEHDTQAGGTMDRRIEEIEKALAELTKTVAQLADTVSKMVEKPELAPRDDKEMEKAAPVETPRPAPAVGVAGGDQMEALVKNILQGKDVNQSVKQLYEIMIQRRGGLA